MICTRVQYVQYGTVRYHMIIDNTDVKCKLKDQMTKLSKYSALYTVRIIISTKIGHDFSRYA